MEDRKNNDTSIYFEKKKSHFGDLIGIAIYN